MPPRFIDDITLQARENELLDSALAIISQHGVVGLTMDKLVASVGYSKGTVYNHFSSKEDVLAALCNRNMKHVFRLFSRAATIANASSREHMTAIGFAYLLSVLMSPQHFMLVMNAKTEIFDKASQARREEHDDIDAQLFGVVCRIIDDAIANKELILTEGVEPRHVSFSMWAMSFGTIGLLLNGAKSCSTTMGMMLESSVIAHGNIVMDGYGWSQSSRPVDAFLMHLKKDVFDEEVAALLQQGVSLAHS